MKNLIYTILGGIIGAFLTYYFCPRELKDDAFEKTIKPKGVISVEQAKELNANWTLHRKAAVDSAAQKQGRHQDDRSTYWSLYDIENYLGYAKNQADSLGYNMTGIRVYLGVYGKNAGQTKKDLTTMFIVPTGKQKKSHASSINIFNFQEGDQDVDVPPLNNGIGGERGYPQ